MWPGRRGDQTAAAAAAHVVRAGQGRAQRDAARRGAGQGWTLSSRGRECHEVPATKAASSVLHVLSNE